MHLRAHAIRLPASVLRTYTSRSVYGQRRYFAVTVFAAEPPRLLRTVMFCGFTDKENSPVYFAPPLLASVPINAPVDVVKTFSVALELVLVASTAKIRSATTYSAT